MSDLLSKIDRNFAVSVGQGDEATVFYDVKGPLLSLHGCFFSPEDDRFVRMPKSAAEAVSGGVAHLRKNPSGGRVRFATDSKKITLRIDYGTLCEMPHMPKTGCAGFDLYERARGGAWQFKKTFVPPNGCPVTLELTYERQSQELCEFELNLPLYHELRSLEIGLTPLARLEKVTPHKHRSPVLFYGSSITQGGCASRPGMNYPTILSRRLDFDFVNLGFSGNGRGEESMARYMASLDHSLLVNAYGINSPIEELRERHYPFYRIYRELCPKTPILMTTSPYFGQERGFAGGRHLDIALETYRRALAEGDENIYFLDGGEARALTDGEAATVDDCHPTDLGFFATAKSMEPLLSRLLSTL